MASTSAAAHAASASVAAAAVANAAVSAVAPPRLTPVTLLKRCVDLLRSQFVAVLLVFAAKDAVAFLLHRITQRLTNHAAEVLLGAPVTTAGNPWWLFMDAAFIRAYPAYQLLVGVFFLLCLPLNIALNSAAFTTAALACCPPQLRPAGAQGGEEAQQEESAGPWGLDSLAAGDTLADLGIRAAPPSVTRAPQPRRSELNGSAAAGASTSPAPAVAASGTPAAGLGAGLDVPLPDNAGAAPSTSPGAAEAAAPQSSEQGGPMDALRAAAASIGAVLPHASAVIQRVWWVDMQVCLRALPLQGLCLLVLPAFWALPRLLRLQLSLPVAVLEGRAGADALTRSGTLMSASLASYGLPFAGLLAGARLLEHVQGVVLVLIPPRWWRDVPEIPLLIAGAFLLLRAAVHRLQDLLPLAAYSELQQQG